MGFGIALGGVAKGLESAEQARVAQQDVGLRKQALGIQEKALKNQEQNALIGHADKLIASQTELAAKIIEAGKQAGEPPEKIAKAVSPILQDIERLSRGVGRDPTSSIVQIDALLGAPPTADPAERKKQLEVDKLEREAAGDVARLEDVAFSASDALKALDTLEEIPGGEVFLLNPGLITPARQALAAKEGGGLLGRLQRVFNKVPTQLTGLSEEQLLAALDAAETVSKQRNALATGLSNQAGTAGLRSQLQARGEGAGLSVQRKVFGQALDLANRELGKEQVPVSTGPLPLPETEAELEKGQVYNLPDGRQALWNGKALELLN